MCFGIFQTLLYGSIDWLYTLHGYAPVLNFSFHRSSSSRSSFGRLVLLLQVVYVRPQILLYHMIWSELRRCKILMREWVERGKTISFIFHEFHYTKSYSCIFACLLNRSYPWEYGISVTCSYLKKNSTTKKGKTYILLLWVHSFDTHRHFSQQHTTKERLERLKWLFGNTHLQPSYW